MPRGSACGGHRAESRLMESLGFRGAASPTTACGGVLGPPAEVTFPFPRARGRHQGEFLQR